MEALRHKLREIREAWFEKALSTDEYKAAVLQAIREYLNTGSEEADAVEALLFALDCAP